MCGARQTHVRKEDINALEGIVSRGERNEVPRIEHVDYTVFMLKNAFLWAQQATGW
ncbi:hypothetical protein SAMN06298226_1726 [Nitrosovibrio sp. Nv4]|nr:hypothetical protein SAMN06298226_1726 [Nitrosovibrio sp. Nv4]